LATIPRARPIYKRGAELIHEPEAVTTSERSEPKTGGLTTTVISIGSAGAFLDALADRYSRRILSSAISRGRSIEEIRSEQRIPLSSCYRKVKRLVAQGLLVVERIDLTDDGKKRVIYRCAFSHVIVNMKDGEVSADVALNPGIAAKLNHRLATRWNGEKDPASWW
jgi:hypothetical protein